MHDPSDIRPPGRFNTIATRLAFWFCLSSIVLTWLLSQVVETVTTTSLHAQISEKLADLAEQTTDKLDQGLFERYREVELFAGRPSLGDPAVPLATKQEQIDRIQQTYQYYAWIGMTDTKGRVLASTGGILGGVDVSARPWFISAIQGKAYAGDLHEAKLLAKALPQPKSGEPLRFLDVAFDYRAPDGTLAGVFGAHLSWEWARAIEQSVITAAAREKHIEAMIVSRDGQVLLGPKGLQGTRLALPGLKDGGNAGIRSEVVRWADGNEYVVGYSKSQGRPPFPGFGWTVLVRQDVKEAFAPLRTIQHTIWWSGFAAALLFSLFGVMNARRISRPLVQLARDVAESRRSGSTLRVPAGAEREITELASSFVALVDNLRHNQDALRELNASLENRVVERTGELAKSEERLRLILENSNDAFIAIGSDGTVTDWNIQAERSFGWTSIEASGQDLARLIIPPAMRERHAAGFQRFLQSGTGPVLDTRIEVTALHRSGREIPVEMSVAAFHDGNGYVANAFLRDITERKAAERRITDSEKRLRAITDHLPVLISYIDQNQRFQFANATFDKWLGVPQQAVVGMNLRELIGNKLYEERREHVERALRGEEVVFEMVSTTLGVERHLHTTYVPDRDASGAVAGFYTLTSDVSEIKLAEQQMALLARHDALTGLPNRYQLDEKLAEATRRCRRSGLGMAVMFLDIDHFKRVNDSLGHAAGDVVLKEFGNRLRASVRVTDTVARLAGDEFIVLLEGLHTATEAETVARKIIASMTPEIVVSSRPLYISTSIGIAHTDGSSLVPTELMAHADTALYAAKASGRNTYSCTSLCRDGTYRLPAVTEADA